MMYDDRTIWRHLDGELPEAEARAFEDALSKDPALARRISELKEVSAAVRGGVPKPPPDFAAKVVARAIAGPVAPVLPLDEARRFLRRVVAAAAFLAAVGLAYLAYEVLPKLVETPLWAGPDNILGK
jgi:anti-sigma factor RsiW